MNTLANQLIKKTLPLLDETASETVRKEDDGDQ